MALKDVKVYVVAVILFSIATSASVLNFFPTVVETLGYGSTETLLLTAPPYVSVSQLWTRPFSPLSRFSV